MIERHSVADTQRGSSLTFPHAGTKRRDFALVAGDF